MNKQEVQEKVTEYSKIEEWNHSYIFPFGITTNDNIKKSPGHNVNKWKRLESIFENLDISDKSTFCFLANSKSKSMGPS